MEFNESFFPDTTSTVDKGFGLPVPKDRNLFLTGYVSQESLLVLNRGKFLGYFWCSILEY